MHIRRYAPKFGSRSRGRELDLVGDLLGVSKRSFLARFAGQAPLLCHGDPRRFRAIFGNAAPLRIASLDTVVAKYREVIHTIEFDKARRLAPRRVAPRKVSAMVRDTPAGYFLGDYHLQFQTVQAVCAGLCSTLGYSERGAYCQGSLENDGVFVPRHCDSTDVLILQLFGTRRWRLQPNSDPPKGLHAPVRFPKHLREGWSPQFSPDSPILVLQPGSALYIPRGWWHEIHSDENSFALTLGFVPRRRDRRPH